jgi:hypothetical protein
VGALDEYTPLLIGSTGVDAVDVSLLMVVIWAGAAFGIFQLTTVVADGRLQDGISGPARATVTSLAGMSTDTVTLAAYGSYAVLAEVDGHPGGFTILMIPYALVAVILATSSRRRAASRRRMPQTGAR